MLACAATSVKAETVILTSPQDYQIMSVSPNGKWACGVYVDFSSTMYGFRWNLESGAIELLSAASSSIAWSVANDGTVSGTFKDTEAMPNHAPVEMPGYYKNGKWNGVEMPQGVNGDGTGYGISDDGHYISGSVMVNGVYTPLIWKDGKIYRNMYNGRDGMPYCLSPDGQTAAGWAYPNVQGPNRCSCYWDADGKPVFLNDNMEMWCAVQRFSPDGKKLLFWGGWNRNEDKWSVLASVYDWATGDIKWIPTIVNNAPFNLYGISNSYTIVGEESYRAYININDKGQYVEDYLAAKGVDFEKLGVIKPEGSTYYMLEKAMAISADDNCIGLRYYDTEGAMRSMVVMLNKEVSHVAPASVTANQLKGIGCVRLSWSAPVGAEGIQGYNIYRDGKKVNAEPVNDTRYYDGNLADGNYSYTVSAVYGDGKDTASEPVQVTVAPQPLSVPQTVFARQKGVNSLFAQWEAPETNLISKGYTDMETANVQGFGVSKNGQSFEVAVKFDKDDISNYSGCKMTAVTFYPMDKRAENWKVNIYTRGDDGKPALIKSQPITQTLNYMSLNTVKLDAPLTLPAGDLIVAIEATAVTASSSILGMDFGHYLAGYSDLLRQKGEDDFYSLVEKSTSGGNPYFTSWIINAVLTPDGAAADIDVINHYNVYVDGAKAGETSDKSYLAENLSDGTHTFGVEAVYAGGKASAVVNAGVDIAARYKGVDNLFVGATGDATVEAYWSVPNDDDNTTISYASGPAAATSVKGPESNNYGIMAGAIFTPSMLKGYDGYSVNAFRFYPLADATFTFILFENDVEVCEFEVSDYTLGQWNTVKLPQSVTVNAGSTYQLVLDCYDVTPDKAPLALDGNMAFDFYSNIYSLDGASWSSITEAGANGNWMLGWTMTAPDSKPLTVSGYDVLVDGVKKTPSPLTEPKFNYDFGKDDGRKHSMRVDTWYPSASVSVEGNAVYFLLGLTGIDGNTVEKLNLSFGDSYIRVDGEGVEALAVYGMNGVKAASASGKTVNITGLASGVYVVKVKTATGETVRKVEICR